MVGFGDMFGDGVVNEAAPWPSQMPGRNVINVIVTLVSVEFVTRSEGIYEE